MTEAGLEPGNEARISKLKLIKLKNSLLTLPKEQLDTYWEVYCSSPIFLNEVGLSCCESSIF